MTLTATLAFWLGLGLGVWLVCVVWWLIFASGASRQGKLVDKWEREEHEERKYNQEGAKTNGHHSVR